MWAEQQPEAFNDRGKKDPWKAYGLHAREMLQFLRHLQRIHANNVIMTSILEQRISDFGREWSAAAGRQQGAARADRHR